MIHTYNTYPGLGEQHSIYRVGSWVNDMLTRIMRYGAGDYVERLADSHRIYRRRFQANNRPRPGNHPLYPNDTHFKSWRRNEQRSDWSGLSRRQRRKMQRALREMQAYYDKYESIINNTYWASGVTTYIDNLKSRLARTRYDGRVEPDIIDTYAAILCSNRYDNDKIANGYYWRTTDDGERKLYQSDKGFAVSHNFNSYGKAERVSWGAVNRLAHIDAAQRRVKAELVWNLESPKYKAVQYVAPSLDDDIPF